MGGTRGSRRAEAIAAIGVPVIGLVIYLFSLLTGCGLK
jgi:hypothetical protein